MSTRRKFLAQVAPVLLLPVAALAAPLVAMKVIAASPTKPKPIKPKPTGMTGIFQIQTYDPLNCTITVRDVHVEDGLCVRID